MKTLLKIWEYLKNPTIQRLLMLVAIFILAVMLFKNCGRTNTDDQILKLEQNISYYKDSLRIEKNKVGDLEYQRSVLAADKKNLEKLNADLAAEVKKEKGTVIYLNKVIIGLNNRIDSLMNGKNGGTIDVKVNDNGTQTIVFTYDKIYSQGNERHVDGNIDVVFYSDKFVTQTIVTSKGDTVKVKVPLINENAVMVSLPKDSIIMTVVTGLQEDKKTGNLEIFVRSNYPGFKIYKLDGALIDPQKSELIKSYFPPEKWGIGFTLGGCIMVDKNGAINIGPMIGVGISYDLWSFNPKKLFKK